MNTGHYTLPALHGIPADDDGYDASPRPSPSPLSHHLSTSRSLRDSVWRETPRDHRGGDTTTGTHTATANASSSPTHSMSSTAWLPSRLTSPYRVLSASSMRDDYYTSSLSWGHAYVGLTLRNEVLVVHSHHPRERFAVFRFGRSAAESHVAAGTAPASLTKRPTAVVVSRHADTTCFVGFDDGTVDLFHAREDSPHLVCGHSFAMPTPPVGDLVHLLASARMTSAGTGARAEAEIVRRSEMMLQQMGPSLSTIGTMDTAAVHPWLAAVGTAASGVLTLDARLPRPSSAFRRLSRSQVTTEAASSSGVTGASTSLGSNVAGSRSGVAPALSATSAVSRVATFLEQQERVCAVRWNASGSLLAVGDDRGVVQIWSLAQPKAPLHTIVVEHAGSLRALAFHPTNPSELLVGCGVAGPHGLRLYDLSSASPRQTWTGHTASPTTQALYSPDGAYIVTAGGEVVSGASASPTVSPGNGVADVATSRSRSRSGEGAMSGVTTAGSTDGVVGVAVGPPWYGMSSTLESAAAAATGGGRRGSLQTRSPLRGLPVDGLGTAGFPHGFITPPPQGAPSPSPPAPPPPPLPSGGFVSFTATGASETVDWRVSHALTVWKRGAARGTHDALRDAIFDGADHSPMRWDDLLRPSRGSGRDDGADRDYPRPSPVDSIAYGSPLDVRHLSGYGGSAPGASASASAGGGGGASVLALMPQYVLRGHTSRPLHLAAPYSPSQDLGCVASVAAGGDGTLRFWRVFTQGGATPAVATAAATAASATAGTASTPSASARSAVVATYESGATSKADNEDELFLDIPLR